MLTDVFDELMLDDSVIAIPTLQSDTVTGVTDAFNGCKLEENFIAIPGVTPNLAIKAADAFDVHKPELESFLITPFPSGEYSGAITDFWGMPSNPRSIYKSGPAWPISKPGQDCLVREARPVHGHPIATCWDDIADEIYVYLDSVNVQWTSIDGVAFANAGESKVLCPLLVWIGVTPQKLLFAAAVAAAHGVKAVLARAGFPDVEVAFRESVVRKLVCSGPKLNPFDNTRNKSTQARKPFTPTLGLSIAPLVAPYHEGTGGLYLRLGPNSDRVALLTASHVANPPGGPDGNVGMSHKRPSQRKKEIIALGNSGYNKAKDGIVKTINNFRRSIPIWNMTLVQLGPYVEGEAADITRDHMYTQSEVADATSAIEELEHLDQDSTRRRSKADQRIIGYVLHAPPITLSTEGSSDFTSDWALVELYREKIDWAGFQGNKIYIADMKSPNEYGELMFPRCDDRASYLFPKDGLLQACGIVGKDEIENPHDLDLNGDKALFVVKNGHSSGTTIGRVNALKSVVRNISGFETPRTSRELTILSYDSRHAPFSDRGDSGSIILDRTGRIVALLTGGTGATVTTDVTYATPYWWLEKEIRKAFPDFRLY